MFAVVSSSFPVWWIGMLMIFLFAFVYHIFPARATPSILPTEPGYIIALLYHMALPLITIVDDWIWCMGISCAQFYGRNTTRRFYHSKKGYRH